MKKIILTLIPVLFVFGCQEVININLQEGPERLVIEGRIEKIKGAEIGYQSIMLTKTDDYFSNTTTPRVRGAKVTVTDNHGNAVIFTESVNNPGLYETDNLFARIGVTYTLHIEYAGDIYEGSETLQSVAPIDSIYQYFVEEDLFNEKGIRVRIDFTDPSDENNYYYWQQFRDGKTLLNPDPGTRWTIVSSDDFFNGQRIWGREPNDQLIYESGQVAKVRQHSISKSQYDFMFLLYDQATGGGPYDSPPVPIRGNVQNLTNPDKYPLGYFGAGEVDERELVIQ
jgi:hypothetical protein